MVKVDLMIIGAQKAGTTSLKNYLGEHPQILTHGQIEMSYFVNDVEYKAGHATGIEPYFSEAATIGKCIVGKNVAISLHEEAVARLVKHNPDCKIVFVMREPVSRAYSMR